jgi:hypothetical protein
VIWFGVELSQLGEVVWVSLLAGVGTSISFSLVVLGGGRSAEARRQGRETVAFAYAALAVVFLCAFGAAVAFGVHTMLAKT